MGVLLWRLAVFVAALCPPLWWLYQAWIFALGPDPGKALVDKLGTGALVLLLLTLSLTPLSRLTRWKLWPVIRRQLGLDQPFWVQYGPRRGLERDGSSRS